MKDLVHHEFCKYYQFGDKMETEVDDGKTS